MRVRARNCTALVTVAVMSLFLTFLASTMAHAQVPAGPNRPAGVPDGYVITPSGYFHPSCVLELAKGETLLADGYVIQHADGTLENIPACDYPRYTAIGEIEVADPARIHPQSINQWVEYASTTTGVSYAEIIATWTVPPAPTSNDGQTVYFFPGLEDINDTVSILQPVLGWNANSDRAWSIASWNCCINGNNSHSPFVSVNPGDNVQGFVVSTCGAGILSCPTWNITTFDETSRISTNLINSPNEGQTFNWAFAGVLEVYNVSRCGDYPPNGFLTFPNVELYDYNFALISNPDWSSYVYPGLTPQCNYGVQVAPAHVSVDYGTIPPTVTSFNIAPTTATVGTTLTATIVGIAGSNPLSSASLLRTTDLTGNTGWTTVAGVSVTGNSVNVTLYDTPPVGTYLYGAHITDNTGVFGTEPSTIQVTVNPLPTITVFNATPSTVNGGGTITYSVTLSGAAPTGGALISFNSSATNVIPNTTLSIPAGATSGQTTVVAQNPASTTQVTITASYGSSSKQQTITVIPAATYSISGYVTLNGNGLAGVSMTLSGGANSSTTTNSSGYYTFNTLVGGLNYAVTPYLSGYTFSPPSQSFTGLNANQTANFAATAVTYSISGQVTLNGSGLTGVTISLSGGVSGSTTTNSSGNYSFAGLQGGLNYTVTPSLSGYTFSPTSYSYTGLNANQTANFSATATAYTISGQVTLNGSGSGVQGVTITMTGGQSRFTTTDSYGNYSFSGLPGGVDYLLVPSLSGYTFYPRSVEFYGLNGNHIQNFTAYSSTYTISGYVTLNQSGVPSVTISLTGGQSGSTTTDSFGYYIFSGLFGGLDYLVTPFLSGYTFSPPSASFFSLSSNQTANFSATATLYALTVSELGSGAGTLTSSPPGINCGSVCTATFAVGTVVTLTATPANGSVFAGWGGACNGTGTCSFTMNSNQSVTATFNPQSGPPVPQINIPVVPVAASPGSPGFTLTVNGSGFVPQSTVNWNGSPRPTAFVSSSQLTTTISAADVSTPETALITIANAGVGTLSNSAYFSVTDATSSISLGRSDLSVASQPESLVTGDLNRDGIPDLAVASFSGAVSVMIGNGDGTFRGHVDYPTGAGTRGIVIGDFNGDGKLDLAVANQTSNTVSILLGNGDGTFQGHVDYSAGTGPFSLAIGDFNGDGALDLAVVNQGTNQVSILRGVGNGTFQFSAAYATGQLPFGIVVGDFNLDGHLDLAVTNYNDNTVSILLGNGDGTFAAHTDYATGILPEMLAAADLNGDGKLDLAVGTNQLSGSQISVLLGNGNGTFGPHSDFPTGYRPRSVLATDLNGDGKVDLAVANYGSNTVSLLLGNGDGTFSSHVDYPTGASPQLVTAGDYAGNGRLDLAVVNYGSNTASVLLQTPAVTLSPTSLNFGDQQVGTTSSPQSVTLTNTGSAPLNVNNIGVQGDFAQTNNCNTLIQAGSDCSISVTFTPTVTGTRNGVLTIADNAADSPQTVSLSGTGTGTIGTTTTLSSSLNPSNYGQAVTLTAVVVPSQSGTPTGSVTFYDGTTALGSVNLTNAVATLTTSALTGGNHSLTATYSGDGTFGASTSPVLTQTVLQTSVSITLTSSVNPSYVDQQVTFTAVVTGTQAVPTGTVVFKQGGNTLGTVTLANGTASLSTTFKKAGSFSIYADYSGDQNYLAGASKILKQVVDKYPTTTSLTSNPNPSSQGQPVTLTATVASPGPTPTGKVTFKNGTKSLGSSTVIKGVATLTTSKLPKGSLSITAMYGGDAASNKSTSPVLIQVVN